MDNSGHLVILKMVKKTKGQGKPDDVPTDPIIENLELKDIMLQLKQNHTEVTTQIKKMSSSLDKIQSDVETNKTSIAKLYSDNDADFLHMEANEQNCRLNSLRLNRAKILPKGASCDTHVCDIINHYLSGELGFEVTCLDLDISHPLGPPDGNNQCFIIKFVRRTLRNQVYRKKKFFAESNGGKVNHLRTYMTEDLTKTRRDIMKYLYKIQEDEEIDSHWSYSGNLYVRPDADSEDNVKIKIVRNPSSVRKQLELD